MVRRVVDNVLQERFMGVERGKWDLQSEQGVILGRLVWALNSDRE